MSGGITGTDMITQILIKKDVKFTKFTPQFASFVNAVCRTWNFYASLVSPVITSANDGKHMVGSLHYKDLAWDLRTNNLDSDRVAEIAHMLRVDLGSDWDIVVEKDHLHCEYDKGGL